MNSKDLKRHRYIIQQREKLGRTNHAWLTDEEMELISNYRQVRNCDHKIRIETETAAMRAAIEQMAKLGSKTKFRHYKCPICKGYHLTSQVSREASNSNGRGAS